MLSESVNSVMRLIVGVARILQSAYQVKIFQYDGKKYHAFEQIDVDIFVPIILNPWEWVVLIFATTQRSNKTSVRRNAKAFYLRLIKTNGMNNINKIIKPNKPTDNSSTINLLLINRYKKSLIYYINDF